MNPKLLKFIELCLVDGVISDKEREVIFRKSKEFGVPEDECEIILEGMIQKLGKKSSGNVIDEDELKDPETPIVSLKSKKKSKVKNEVKKVLPPFYKEVRMISFESKLIYLTTIKNLQ